jgi:hypothetical protein
VIDQYPPALPKETFSQAVPVIEAAHHFVHSGEVFRYQDAATIGSGSSQDYLITTPNATPYGHLLLHIDGTAITSFYLFEAADRSGTTPQTVLNANRNSATAAAITVHKGTSGGTTDGTQLIYYASGSAQGSSKSPAALNFNSEWILKINTKYIVRIASGTSGNLCNIMLEWYEHVSGT